MGLSGVPTRVWKALVGIAVILLVAVVALDQWQARRGEASLFGLSWPGRPPAAPAAISARALPDASTAPLGPGAPRIAVIVDDLGGRRDVFELVRAIQRPVAVAVLPALPLTQVIGREAAGAGLEVLLDLPMEPYRYPEIDPGPGALLMSMSPGELQTAVRRHLAALPGAVGVVNHLGSRLTEDRARMRALVEVLGARRLFLVDAYASNLSLAYSEARELGVRAARRQVVIDHTAGEAAARARWDEVAGWADRRGEVVVIAHGHPLTVRLLREYIPRWEARGLRLVPVSELAR